MKQAGTEQWWSRDVVRLFGLLESEKRYYNRILSALPVGVVVFNRELRAVSVNRAFRQILDLGVPDILARPIEEILPDAELKRRVAAVFSGVTAEAGYDLRMSLRGRPLYLRTSVLGLRSEEDELCEVGLILEDLTDLESRRAGAAEAEQRYRQLVDNLGAVVYEADASTLEYVSVSARAGQWTGLPSGEWRSVQDSLLPRVAEEDRARVLAAYRDAAEGQGKKLEYRLTGSAERQMLVQDILTGCGSKGPGRRIQGLLVDVTAERRAEEQARKHLRIEALREMVERIAQEFSDPLTAILGHCDLLAASLGDTPPHSVDIRDLKRAADRVVTLTNQVLAFAQGRESALRTLDLNIAVGNMEELLRHLAGNRIELAVNLTARDARIQAEPKQLEQLILHLVSNARDAIGEQGKVMIETRLVESPAGALHPDLTLAEGSYVALAVTDNGAGMSEEIKSRVFEPFFTTKRKGRGAGLGLSTVYGIVKQAGGDIAVESAPGRGTTVTVYYPKADSMVEAGSREYPEIRSLAGVETVLLIDEDERIRGMVRRILQENGYQVLEASQPDEALRKLQRHRVPPQVVVINHDQAALGREFVKHLREALPHVKILLMTGNPKQVAEYGRWRPADTALIQKPFAMHTLLYKVRGMLGGAANGEPRPD